MAKLSADQIIKRIANANSTEAAVMRPQIEQVLHRIIREDARSHSFTSEGPFSDKKPTFEELVIALEYELYDAMMPEFPGWEWDGEGYRNTGLLAKTGKSF